MFGVRLTQFRVRSRRGGAYVAVLALCLVVVAMGVGGLMSVRMRAREADAVADSREARQYANSGAELGRLWIYQDANWRTNRPNGTWVTNQAIGNGTFSLSVVDPADGDLTNRPYDSVVMTATGVKGQARQIVQVTLAASPVALPALKYAICTVGQLHVNSGKTLTASNATVSTNGALRNDGTIYGSAEVGSSTGSGTVSGTTIVGTAAKVMPDSGVVNLYVRLGTVISPGNTMEKVVLSPGKNPYGTANAEGVYVINTSNDLMIRNMRLNGTLVVNAPGKKVTIDQQVLMQPARSDYPVLIVNGNAVFSFTSGGTPLSEVLLLTNFNPTGAPYAGVTNSTTLDVYPSEIQGLVHVTGTVLFSNVCTIRGALICESSANTDAVQVNSNAEVIYDSGLYTAPPQGYTTQVKMPVATGGWKRVVN